MNLIRKAEELRKFAAESLEKAKQIGGTTLDIVTQYCYNIIVLLSKIDIWKQNGAKTFVLSKELVEAFHYTDIPLDMCPSDFDYPFETFLIECIDSPLFTTKTCMGIKNVYSILYLSDSAVYKNNSNCILLKHDGTAANRLEWNKSLTAFFPAEEDIGLENIMIHMKDKTPIIEVVNQTEPRYGIIPLDKEDAQNMVNIFYNTIMYINDPDRNRTETESIQTRKLKKGDGKSRTPMNYILLRPPKSYTPISKSAGGRTIDKRFIVRGHHKMQVYGKNFSLRKPIWIKPYWKGPELAEIINKPYKLK